MPGKPTYDLQQLQQLVGQGELSRTITAAATHGASSIRFTADHIIEAVLLLTLRDFHKTMESERIPGLWQDVYRLEYRQQEVYIKLQIGSDGRAYVVQFKRR